MASKGHRQLQPIPDEVFSILGPLLVKRVPNVLTNAGKESSDLGSFDYHLREITLLDTMHHTQAWHTLMHERVHSCLFDAGIVLSDRTEEQVCDAIATLLVAEMLNTLRVK